MKILGLAGWSGAGKTTLLKQLIPELNQLGLSVSTMKHAHHSFDVDQEGKDSYFHRQAGAKEVLIASEKRWALMHEYRDESEASLAQLLKHMSPVDLVLIEGFKKATHPKIEIYRSSLNKPLLAANDANIIAIAADAPIPLAKVKQLALNDISNIALFVQGFCFDPGYPSWPN